ncbi:MAG: hypothetical protein ACR2OF_02055 [Hyphomicrobium sp.]
MTSMQVFGKSGLRPSLALLLFLAVLSFSAYAKSSGKIACEGVDYNRMIIEIIDSLPRGGGYDANPYRVELPIVSARKIGSRWEMRVRDGILPIVLALHTHYTITWWRDCITAEK